MSSTLVSRVSAAVLLLAGLALLFAPDAVLPRLIPDRAKLPGAVWTAVALAVVLAVAYGWLLWRGPLPKDWGKRDAR